MNKYILRCHDLNSKPITINLEFKGPSLCLWIADKKKKTQIEEVPKARKEETH